MGDGYENLKEISQDILSKMGNLGMQMINRISKVHNDVDKIEIGIAEITEDFDEFKAKAIEYVTDAPATVTKPATGENMSTPLLVEEVICSPISLIYLIVACLIILISLTFSLLIGLTVILVLMGPPENRGRRFFAIFPQMACPPILLACSLVSRNGMSGALGIPRAQFIPNPEMGIFNQNYQNPADFDNNAHLPHGLQAEENDVVPDTVVNEMYDEPTENLNVEQGVGDAQARESPSPRGSLNQGVQAVPRNPVYRKIATRGSCAKTNQELLDEVSRAQHSAVASPAMRLGLNVRDQPLTQVVINELNLDSNDTQEKVILDDVSSTYMESKSSYSIPIYRPSRNAGLLIVSKMDRLAAMIKNSIVNHCWRTSSFDEISESWHYLIEARTEFFIEFIDILGKV